MSSDDLPSGDRAARPAVRRGGMAAPAAPAACQAGCVRRRGGRSGFATRRTGSAAGEAAAAAPPAQPAAPSTGSRTAAKQGIGTQVGAKGSSATAGGQRASAAAGGQRASAAAGGQRIATEGAAARRAASAVGHCNTPAVSACHGRRVARAATARPTHLRGAGGHKRPGERAAPSFVCQGARGALRSLSPVHLLGGGHLSTRAHPFHGLRLEQASVPECAIHFL
jgi:hypothetical protein